MNRASITQKYFVLAINEKGNMPAMHKDESNAGIVAAGVMDLLLNDVIKMEKKKITVMKELPDELRHLSSLYTYLNQKTRSTEKLMNDYIASTGSRIKQLITDLGESLFENNAVTKGEGGLFGNKTIYIPEKSYKEEVIDFLKTAVTKDNEISPTNMALIFILRETKNLNQYVSKEERDELKAKLKEMKKESQNKQLADMISYVSDITSVVMACIVTSLN